MLAYASNRPVVGKRESSPNTLLLIISVHVALLAAVMSSKVDVGSIIHGDPPLIKIPIPPAPPPPPTGQTSKVKQQQDPVSIDQPPQTVKTPPSDPPRVDTTTTDPGTLRDGTKLAMGGETPPPRTTAPIRHPPQLLSPASELKPPYPASKLAAEQEATLRLALTIDERGRVTAVQPVGYADREFLDAARRYIIGHWRYQPATEDGRAMSSTLTVTLQFQLDG